jgi:hypothetical protein
MANKRQRNQFRNLLELIRKEWLHKAQMLQFTLAESEIEFMCGEEGLAIELLTENLNEINFQMPDKIIKEFAKVKKSLKLPD